MSSESKHEAAHTPTDDADRQVLRALIEVCEDTEDKYHGSANDFERGRAFEAKHIRRGVSTWYQDTFCGQTHMGEPVFARAHLAAEVERLRKSERDNEAQLVRIAACIGKDARQAPDHDRTIAGAAIAEVERLREENAELRTVMVAAAEEIHAHWGAHCDSEGYGPANLMRRLEEGIPAEYGYTAGRFAELQAESAAERRKVGALREALRPLWPVIEHAMAGLVFTAKRAGEVTAQMNAVRAALAASDPQRGSEPSTLQTPNPPDQGTFPKAP